MKSAARSLHWIFIASLCSITLLLLMACDDTSTSTSPPPSQADPLALTLSRGSWTLAAHPAHSSTPPGNSARAKLLWHNSLEGVPGVDVWGRDTRSGEGVINDLRLIFRPRLKLVNHYQNRAATDTIRTDSWAGIMTYFAGIGKTEVQHFEVRLKGTHGRLHFDFGHVSEDVDGNFVHSGEDGCTDAEDIGLDGRPDSLEIGYDRLTNPDPGGDDWYSHGQGKCPLAQCFAGLFDDPGSPFYYDFLNGTEGNCIDLVSEGKPDEERLTRSGFNVTNSYYSFVVDLSDTLSEHSFYVPPTNQNGWKTFRIPIRDTTVIDATITSDPDIPPNWEQVTHVRVWFDAGPLATVPDTVQIGEWKFTKD